MDAGLGNGKPVAITDSFAVQNFIKAFFPELEETVQVYPSAQKVFGELVKERYAGQKVKTVYLTDVREFGAESQETKDVDFTINAREVYRIFLRTGGAPARKYPAALDVFGEVQPSRYDVILKDAGWNLETEAEVVTLTVDGTAYSVAIAHNLGQTRQLLEKVKNGDCPFDIVRLNA